MHWQGVNNLRVLLCILSFFLFFDARSQPLNLSFEHIEPGDGLSNRYVDFIYPDSRGFVWISSMAGVFRYDGLKVDHFTPENTKTDHGTGILGRDIQSDFFEDSHGNIWFSPINGINCYERKTGSFLQFLVKDEAGNEIKEGYCLFFLEKDSTLWLKAGSHIFRYHTGKDISERIVETNGFRFTVDTTPDGSLETIYACPWIMNPGVERIRLTTEKTVVKQVLLENGIPPGYEIGPSVSKAILENDTLIWLISDLGLIDLDPEKGSFRKCYPFPGAKNDFFKDGASLDEGRLFLISKNSGLWLFDKKTRKFTRNFPYDENNPAGISSNQLREVHLDNQNHLWLSDYEKTGISHSWAFRNSFRDPFALLDLPSPVGVTSLLEDARNRIWTATKEQGLYIFDINGKVIDHFPYAPHKGSYLPPIRQLTMGPENEIWALADQAIFRLEGDRWVRVYSSKERLFNMIHLSASQILVSSGKGIFELGIGPVSQEVSKEKVLGTDLEFQVFYMLYSEKFRRCFFSNKGNELAVYILHADSLKRDTTYFIGAEVYAIWEEEEGNPLALGTSNGAYLLDLDTDSLVNMFPEEEELANTQVYSISRDTKGRYWVATNTGLWSYSMESGELFHYRQEDGIPSREFSLYAQLRASDGALWLGTTSGVAMFHPDSIRPFPYGPKIQIRGLQVNQQPWVADGNIEEIKSLQLHYKQNTLEFDVVGITHYLGRFNKLFYKLESYNENWIPLENGAKIQFIKIPPGSYSLKIYGENANGLRGEVRQIDITISPPFWQTTEFILAALVLLGGMSYGVFRFFLNRKLKLQRLEFERQEELKSVIQEERNRIAGEMHEDLGGGLTTIQLITKGLEMAGSGKKEGSDIRKIRRYADELIDNMRTIIWAMNSSYDNLPDLAAYIRRYLVEYLDDNGISCTTSIPRDLPDFVVSEKKRRNLFLCLKECAHNTVKHSGATQVYLDIHWDRNLMIIFRDNGKGIDPGRDTQFSNGLKNMAKRMEEIGGRFETRNHNGLQVDFEIPLEVE